jgi:hypothetical protein
MPHTQSWNPKLKDNTKSQFPTTISKLKTKSWHLVCSNFTIKNTKLHTFTKQKCWCLQCTIVNNKQTLNTCQLSKCKNQRLIATCQNNTKMLKFEIWLVAKKFKP